MRKKNKSQSVKFSGYIRIPKAFFLDPHYSTALSPIAKMLYGLLADRSSLSAVKGEDWRDRHNNIFVYFSIEETQERFHCCHDTAAKAMKQLADAGLIRRTRYRNTYQIVVLHADTLFGKDTSADISSLQEPNFPDDCIDKIDANNTENNKPESNNPDSSMDLQELMEQIKENISYSTLLTLRSKEQVDGVIQVMTDTLTSTSPIKIRGQEIPISRIRECFLALDDMDITYVLDSVKRESSPIRNMPGYILTRLYEAKTTKEFFYENWLTCDEHNNQS